MQVGLEEGRRQAWLAALGIPLFTARHSLPGALGAEPLHYVPFESWQELPVEEETTNGSATENINSVEPPLVVSSSVVAAPPPVAARQVIAEQKIAPSSSVMVASPPRSQSASYPRFRCYIQQLSPNTMGLITLADMPDLSASEHQLLSGIVQMLAGDAMGSFDEQRFRFQWPLSANPTIRRDADALRETLTQYCQRFPDCPRWIVFGETVAIYMKAALPQKKVLAAPTLNELLRNPIAKRQLWQALYD